MPPENALGTWGALGSSEHRPRWSPFFYPLQKRSPKAPGGNVDELLFPLLGVALLVIQEVGVSLKYYRRGFIYLPLLQVL